MSREYFNGGCGLNICPKSEPHFHARCDSCGAQDYTNPQCEVCVTLAPAYRSMQAIDWTLARIGVSR